MVQVCCFDLDGTLLSIDTDNFIQRYLRQLGSFVAEMIPPDKLVPCIWEATQVMIENDDPSLTNAEVFQEHFLTLSNLGKETFWPLLDRFYVEEFPKLREGIDSTPLSREVVQAALDRGYRVVVATNPVFPRTAIFERMRWANVADLPFEHVTVNEETHFCKPNPNYYQEIADRLDVAPESCAMIGNDMREDMVAQKIGMKTYLVTDFLLDRGKPSYPPDQQGSLKDLLHAIRSGEGIFA